MAEHLNRTEPPPIAKVLVLGRFNPSDVRTVIADSLMLTTPAIQAEIAAKWAPKAAGGFFPGPLVRVEGYRIHDSLLDLSLSRTDFRVYAGTRDNDFLVGHGANYLANPLSTSAAIITADRKLVIGAKRQGDAVGSIDAIGGFVNPEKDLDSFGKIDIFRAARREACEELGLNDDEDPLLTETTCLGLSFEYANLCHTVANFIIETSLTSEEIIKRSGTEVQVMVVEPERVTHLPNGSFPFVMDVLEQNYPNVEPDGRITIALARQWLSNYRVIRTADYIHQAATEADSHWNPSERSLREQTSLALIRGKIGAESGSASEQPRMLVFNMVITAPSNWRGEQLLDGLGVTFGEFSFDMVHTFGGAHKNIPLGGVKGEIMVQVVDNPDWPRQTDPAADKIRQMVDSQTWDQLIDLDMGLPRSWVYLADKLDRSFSLTIINGGKGSGGDGTTVAFKGEIHPRNSGIPPIQVHYASPRKYADEVDDSAALGLNL